MTPEERPLIIATLAEWAKANPEITRVIIFGSRARAKFRADSDLDVAVELGKSKWDEPLDAVWMTSVGSWRRELEPRIPWILDLQWHDPSGETPIITAGIAAGHIVAYEAQPLEPAAA